MREWKSASNCHKCVSRLSLHKPIDSMLGHCGPTDARLRLILPIKSGEDKCSGLNLAKEKVPFVEKQWIAFDDSYEHSIFNECQDDVILLTVDVPHPDSSEDRTKFSRYAKNAFAHI